MRVYVFTPRMLFQMLTDYKLYLAVANELLFDCCLFNSILTFYFSGAVINKFEPHALEEAARCRESVWTGRKASQDQTQKCAHRDSAYPLI